MKTVVTIAAVIVELQRHYDSKLRITATYEMANTASSIVFDVGIEDAKSYYVGQEIKIAVMVEG